MAILSCAFLVGGTSAEVAVRTHAAVQQVERERELGSAGELVALRLTTSDGSLVAQPRVIAPAGRPARLLLHRPGRPDEVLLSFRVQTERQGGLILLRYELSLPDRSLLTTGRLKLAPGVQHAIALPQGDLVATWMAVPVPSDAFEDYLQAEFSSRPERG
ncbi:MAG TPA: hypothetical protein VFG59_19020 [Anaeromyxobacter sp.]|nr:hypothetical protein [Anaeromyxobacter sp.]